MENETDDDDGLVIRKAKAYKDMTIKERRKAGLQAIRKLRRKRAREGLPTPDEFAPHPMDVYIGSEDEEDEEHVSL